MNKHELISVAQYTKINLSLMNAFKTLSVTKLIFLSFCLNNCVFELDHIGKQKIEVFEVFMKHIGPQIKLNGQEFVQILESIKLLILSGYLDVSENEASLVRVDWILDKQLYDYHKYRRVFEEINKMNDEWFLEEIIAHV